MIGPDPDVSNGRESTILPTKVSVALVLRHLAFGTPSEETGRLFRRAQTEPTEPSADPAQVSEFLQAAAAYGATLVMTRTLPSPVAAALKEDYFFSTAGLSLHEAREWAIALLAELQSGTTRERSLAIHRELSLKAYRASLIYAQFVAASEGLPALREAGPEDRALVDGLLTDDQSRIDNFVEYLSAGGARLDLATYTQGLGRLIGEIESGYTDVVDEYMHDLSARDLMETVMQLVSPPGKQGLRGFLDPWDARFFDATRRTDVPLQGRLDTWRPLAWWWYRVPLRHGQAFGVHLAAHAIS
ncbi:MAG: hypothetical protein ACRDHY_16010 [Anaerolineales bacterium]